MELSGDLETLPGTKVAGPVGLECPRKARTPRATRGGKCMCWPLWVVIAIGFWSWKRVRPGFQCDLEPRRDEQGLRRLFKKNEKQKTSFDFLRIEKETQSCSGRLWPRCTGVNLDANLHSAVCCFPCFPLPSSSLPTLAKSGRAEWG